MAAMPSTQRLVDAALPGRCSTARSKSSASAEHLADEALGGEAEHRLALLGGAALEVQELGALALEGGEVLVALALELVGAGALRRLAARPSGRRRGAARAGADGSRPPAWMRASSSRASSAWRRARSRSRVSRSISAASLAGETSIAAARCWARVVSVHVAAVPDQL